MDDTAKPSSEGSGTNRENYKKLDTKEDVNVEEIIKRYEAGDFDDLRLNVCVHHTISNMHEKSNDEQTESSDTDDTTSNGSAVVSDENVSMLFDELIVGKPVIPFPLPKQNDKTKNKRKEAKEAQEQKSSRKNDDGREA